MPSAASSSDLELLEAWRGGDLRAGNALFQRHFAALSRFFRNKIDVGVEDLIQDTFLACVEGRDRFAGRSSFRTYLFSVARHLLYARYRRRQRDLDVTVTSVIDLGASPSRPLGRREEEAALLKALRSIPIEHQIALELAYWEGMKGPEIAEILGITANTARSRLARARAALRKALADDGASLRLSSVTPTDLDAWAASLRDVVAAG
ncbi:MAG: sigma-70 family RNA polymerase sigma factor [Myxococcales bacterium]|nr:sigma-70 family RNA polymerase sigma factor [Myxococcales bacterium]